MRIGETDENFLNGVFWEVMAKMFHRVGSHHANIVVFVEVEHSICPDLLSRVVDELVPDFKPKDQLRGEVRS